MSLRRLLLPLLLLAGGCSSLLPSEQAEVGTMFRDYDDAQAAYDRVEPGKTTRSELFTLGFDPLRGGNGRLLSFLDVRTLFVQQNVPLEYLPESLISCLKARERCTGYAFDYNQTHSKRVGNFWADTFNFRKKREVHGWIFRAVFVLVDDTLVHKMFNGEPRINRYEVKRNPLGPLQGVGDVFINQVK